MLKINPTPNQNPNFCSEQRIPYSLMTQTRMVVSAMQDVNPRMQQLNTANCTSAKNVIDSMKKLIGLDTIFQEGGLSLSIGDKIIKIFSPNSMLLKIREENAENQKEFKSVELKNDTVLESHGLNSRISSIEEFLNSVFEKIDFPILQLRKFLRETEVEKVLKRLAPKAVLDENTAKITDDIINLYNEVQERISSVPNMVTRSKIKNSYINAQKSIHGSKQLEFCNVGAMEENYSVNIVTTNNGEKNLVIKINKKGEEEQVIIVDSKYRALKEKDFSKNCNDSENSSEYYTQQEINSPLFSLKLKTLKKELENYNKYLKETITKFNKYKAEHTTGEVGTIDKKTLALIKDLMNQFDGCKAKMLKIKDAPRKNAFKQKYGIETRMSSPSLIFKNFNEQGESVHLSFPTMSGVRCMKIVVEKQNGNIGKSFFVNGDKLVKFNATSLGRSKRVDVGTYYYSQEEIEASGLNEYLQTLKKRISIIPKSY